MKRFLFLPALVAVTLFCSCEKQTEAERNADIERKVQDRLAAERKTEEQEKLAARVAELEAARQQSPATQQTTVASEQAVQDQDEDSNAPSGPARRPRQPESDDGTATYTTFYDKLEPLGEWRETADYGYVWQPPAARNRTWRPYTNGRWAYTDAGWTWISQEPFGWATYHYGRWTRLRNIGWVWVPGNEWAPAWVSWRSSNDYVGWAPLPPEARFEHGAGIHNWADSYYDIGPEQYCFVATNQLGDREVERAVVPVDRNITIVNQTTNVTNITYSNTTIINNGPNYDEIRGRSRQPIERLRLQRQTTGLNGSDLRSVVRGDVLEIHAPSIARAQPVERPRRVKERLSQVEVERGWEGFSDRQAVDKLRVKMKSEATPPPNAPSKTFVKPVTEEFTPTVSTQKAAPSVAASAAPVQSAPPVTGQSPGPVTRGTQPARKFIPPEPSATATAASTATATPLSTATPLAATPPPQSSPVATGTPFVRATPAGLVRPGASVPPGTDPKGEGAKAFRERMRAARAPALEKNRIDVPPPKGKVPMPLVSPTSTSTPESSGTAVPAPSASVTPPPRGREQTNAPANQDAPATAKELRRDDRKERRLERRGEPRPGVSPSPSTAPQ